MYVCRFVKCHVIWAAHVNYAYKLLGQCATRVLYKALHTFCHGTDMERHRQNATKELRDRRRQGDRERRMVTHQQESMYVAPSVWRVNPSSMLMKLRNTGSKAALDSIYVSTQPSSFYRETRLSAVWLKAADLACTDCQKWQYEAESHVTFISTMGPKGLT